MSDYPESRLDVFDVETREFDRRSEKRCLCGHGLLWHMGDGKCFGKDCRCECLEFIPQTDRRNDND